MDLVWMPKGSFTQYINEYLTNKHIHESNSLASSGYCIAKNIPYDTSTQNKFSMGGVVRNINITTVWIQHKNCFFKQQRTVTTVWRST